MKRCVDNIIENVFLCVFKLVQIYIYIYFVFHLHCIIHDILDKERDLSAPENDFNTCLFPQDGSVINFTDSLQYSDRFRDTLNQSSMVYGK